MKSSKIIIQLDGAARLQKTINDNLARLEQNFISNKFEHKNFKFPSLIYDSSWLTASSAGGGGGGIGG